MLTLLRHFITKSEQYTMRNISARW